jgi:hypothetical protein
MPGKRRFQLAPRIGVLIPPWQGGHDVLMNDLREKLAKLREDVWECELMSSRAHDPEHRAMLSELAAKLRQMIDDVEAAIARIAGEPD